MQADRRQRIGAERGTEKRMLTWADVVAAAPLLLLGSAVPSQSFPPARQHLLLKFSHASPVSRQRSPSLAADTSLHTETAARNADPSSAIWCPQTLDNCQKMLVAPNWWTERARTSHPELLPCCAGTQLRAEMGSGERGGPGARGWALRTACSSDKHEGPRGRDHVLGGGGGDSRSAAVRAGGAAGAARRAELLGGEITREERACLAEARRGLLLGELSC